MDNKVHFGDGVRDEAIAEANSGMRRLVKMVINLAVDWAENKIKDFPEAIKQLRNNPDAEQEIFSLWSEHLLEEGLIPKAYSGLPDNVLISTFQQEGYSAGLYIGYILAMMALVDNNASKDMILTVRDYIRLRPKLLSERHYDDKCEVIDQYYEDEKYRWIEIARKESSGTN